ncbi:MAG: LacI family DNA-binding transcriptional regulator [Bacteroidales bacterium]|nr:LacI family DNA-binding transcriptional regulator [Bacteroidales bacterium]
MKENLSTIASRTGVSITTVSRVLSGNASKYRISNATAERIKAEAARCNYAPSIVAQNLRKRKTRTIGLLTPSLSNPYFAEMASSIISEVHRRGYTTIVIDTMEDEGNFNEGLTQLVARQVDGIIAVPCGQDHTLVDGINNDFVPVMLVDRYYEDYALPYVTTNNYKGGFDATSLLIDAGHKSIACIQGVRTSAPNNERVRGYRDAMEEAKLSAFEFVAGNEFSIQNGYLETKLLLSRHQRPTAIFALSNNISLGVLKALREARLRIPDDLSLVSFDNYAYMDYMEPPLTRVSQPVEDMAILAAKILFDRIDGLTPGASQLRLSPTIIQGESVGRL